MQVRRSKVPPSGGVKPARRPGEAGLMRPGGLNPGFELATIDGEPYA